MTSWHVEAYPRSIENWKQIALPAILEARVSLLRKDRHEIKALVDE